MKAIGRPIFRVCTLVSMVLFALAFAMPTLSAAEAFQSDDFNQCGLNTSIWTFENPGNAPALTVNGAYSGSSALVMTVPSGQDMTFSGKNTKVPRIMQSATDTSFEVEVKFNSALGQTPGDTYNIQGILVRDTTSVPGKTKWLRFDLDTNSTSINYYVAYFDENGVLHGITGPQIISSQMSANPLYLRVKYDQPTGTWSVGYALTDPAAFRYKFDFTEATAPNVTGGFTFNVTGMGVFAGSTSPGGTGTPPGITSNIDYFKSMTNASFANDAIKLTVQKVGPGNVNQTCSGNQIGLTAVPNQGVTFSGWSGDVTSTQAKINLTMTKSFNVTATFNGVPVDLPFKYYIPVVRH
jgi:hypothetical protein